MIGSYKVLSNQRVSKHSYVLKTERPPIEIHAGQCFSVGTRGLGINREYSMYSAADAPFVEFLIREVEDGIVSAALAKLQAGDDIQISGPYGEFCLNEQHVKEGREFVFLATGTGIAPFRSFVKTYPHLNYRLIHGIRHPDEAYHATDYAPDRYVTCISQPANGEASLRITDYVRANPLKPDTICYLCGNQRMITDAIAIIREQGIHGGNIFTETFF